MMPVSLSPRIAWQYFRASYSVFPTRRMWQAAALDTRSHSVVHVLPALRVETVVGEGDRRSGDQRLCVHLVEVVGELGGALEGVLVSGAVQFSEALHQTLHAGAVAKRVVLALVVVNRRRLLSVLRLLVVHRNRIPHLRISVEHARDDLAALLGLDHGEVANVPRIVGDHAEAVSNGVGHGASLVGAAGGVLRGDYAEVGVHLLLLVPARPFVQEKLAEEEGQNALNHRGLREGHFVQQQDLPEHEGVREGAVHVLDVALLRDHDVAEQLLDGGGGTEVVAHEGKEGAHAVLFHGEGLSGGSDALDQRGDVVEERVFHDLVSQLRLLRRLDERPLLAQRSHASVGEQLDVLPVASVSLQRHDHPHLVLCRVEDETVRRAVDRLDRAVLQLEGES